jgi:hypothetical protein
MDISSELKNEIMFESSKFAAAEVPDGLSEENKMIVQRHLNNSFIGAFNRVVYIASLLCLLGSLIAFRFIRGEMPGKKS